jgi:hypothetical protein
MLPGLLLRLSRACCYSDYFEDASIHKDRGFLPRYLDLLPERAGTVGVGKGLYDFIPTASCCARVEAGLREDDNDSSSLVGGRETPSGSEPR